MSRPISYTSAVTFYPAGTTGVSNITGSTQYPYSNGYNGTGNTSNYARLQLNASSTSTDCYIYYTFSISNIPEDATINSVSCSARISRNSRVSNSNIQLYNGTTAKGSSTTFTSTNTNGASVTITNISSTGSWSVNELNNIRLRISGRRSNTNYSSYIYFWGCDLTINYTVNGVAYEITASSNYTGATVSPLSQEVMGGEAASVKIYTDDINSIVVEDNTIDVTENLQYVVPQGGNFSFTGIPSSYDSENSTYEGIYTGTTDSGLSNQDSNDRICVYAHSEAYSISKLVYNFDCSSIPQNATITSVSCVAAAACYSNGQYFDTKILQLYNGNTAKGTGTTITGNGSTKANHNINGGEWTRSELDDIKIVIYIQRGSDTTQASVSFWGATLTVNYTIPSDPYYEYTLTNINDDHNIVVSESIYIPPEEDPEKTYYSLTISSINATTDPRRGTTRVESGDGQTITITPSDPQVTLILDNGVDVSSQLVSHGSAIQQPTVNTAPGASYGFNLNSSTGYYVSQNAGVNKSAAVCKVSFNLPVRCLVTIQFINYAEQGYDFGVFGNIDVTLTNNYYEAGSGGATITDSNYKLACNTSSYNSSSPQTLTYEMPSGEHFIYIKYSKDDASEDNNDTLQFKVLRIEPLEINNYYTYTLSNISQDHSLVFIFGDVSYYFVESSLNGEGRINPVGQMVQLQGDNYKLTIVPSNANDSVSITDNNVDVTGNLVMKQETIEKDGEQYTVTNYTYTLTNIGTGHTLSVNIQKGVVLYMKQNSSWVAATKVYTKSSGRWAEVDDIERLFSDENIYILQ